MAKKKSTKKKSKPTYIREIEIRYKKKRVSGNTPVGSFANGAEKVAALFADLQNETKEKMIAISLDIKFKIITFEVVAIGSIDGIYTRPADAIRASIMVNAYGVIIVHNHPSGDPSPSVQDKNFTKKLKRSCDDLGLALHDHVIIGDGSYFSFASEDLL